MGKTYKFSCGCSWPVTEEDTPPDVLPLMDVDVEEAPEDCPATWAMLGRGLTKGVFQLESPLGRQWTKKLKPNSLEHMSALGALLRPGCLRAVDEDGISMTAHYCRRRHGQEEVRSYHPVVDAVLTKTYNVVVFQEQLMELGRVLAGFDLVAVDRLRKSVGKKNQKLLAEVRDEFLAGAAKCAVVTKEQAAEVWGWIQASGRYAFNRSHSACYGVTGYHSAYIKAHWPLAFFTAWLKNAKHKQDPQQEVFELVNDARLFDVEIEPPDLRSGEADVHTDRRVVKFGLGNVKGVGPAQVEKLRILLSAMKRPIGELSWWEFLVGYASDFTASVLTRFIQVGALRWTGMPRSMMEAEFKIWDSLTAKEQGWVRDNATRFSSLVPALRALALPKQPKAVAKRVPKKGQEQKVATLEQEHADLIGLDGGEAFPDLAGRIAANREAYEAATKFVKCLSPEVPAGTEGGCANDSRRQTVLSHVQLYENPATVRADTPMELAVLEEQLLGISISCQRVDSCDVSQVNCTCKEFMAGRNGFMLLGIEVQEVREFKTKSGKTPGAKYGRMTVSDGTCSLEAVCWPDSWKDFGRALAAPGSLAIVQAERDYKDKESTMLVIRRAWEAQNLASTLDV